jgi:addiction module RelE/StbE family toxin
MWQVKIHQAVVLEDFKKISHPDRTLILKTIYKKLSVAPEEYGKLLRGDLYGYWKLKISQYRVIYKIEKQSVHVLVFKVGMRRDEEVYRQAAVRLQKIKGH